MMTTDEVKSLILQALPDADVEVQDTTGTGDHFAAQVVSAQFAGKSLIAQHRMVMDAVKEAMAGMSAPLHAFDLKTKAR
jgi:stress-induced morphogen